MPVELPDVRLCRAEGIALLIIAALTASMVWLSWDSHPSFGSVPFPLVVSFLLFNAGFVWAAGVGGFQTKGHGLGIYAVLMNCAALVSHDFKVLWAAISAAAVCTSIVGAWMLFRDARTAAR